jgi:anaerobic sulfite reductase subunit C
MYDRKELTRNALRITRDRGLTALRIRVPGGHLQAGHLRLLQELAERFGNGTLHMTTRQGFEIPGIRMDRLDEVRRAMAPLIAQLETNAGLDLGDLRCGYPAAGTRNVSACIGNRVCPFANYDTTALACRIESAVYPSHLHVKIACTGCPNDCIKAHMQDYGVIGMTEPHYDETRCISCRACIDVCRKRVTQALTMRKYNVERDGRRCIGCGECVMACPTGAMTRSRKKLFNVVIMGRTGKRNPRIAQPFLRWVDEDVVMRVLRNLYAYAEKHRDRALPKEHVGYIVDRTGYPAFRDAVLADVTLGPEAQVAESMEFGGYWYERNIHFRGCA